MKQSDINALSDEQLCSACSDWNGAMEELLRRHENWCAAVPGPIFWPAPTATT